MAVVDVKDIKSEVLKRLIEEIKIEMKEGSEPESYNRCHNRHNRSG